VAGNTYGIGMTCPYLDSGRCKLSEQLALQELSVSLVCPTDERQCAKCIASGVASEEKPTNQVLGNVFLVCPQVLKGRWRAFRDYATTGRPRGLGDRVEKVFKATGVAAAVKGIAKAVGVKDCGCGKRKKKLNDAFPDQRSHSSKASVQEKPG
jgi:hypothetical protein